MNNTTQKTYPRDVFMHLLNTIALYVSTFSVLNLIFDYINIGFPDPLNLYYDPASSIRWELSLFIIIFGVFVWTSWFIEKDLRKSPEKNELRLRRWLIYLTVFLAALLLIGDLVALIYNFLGGELTTPFILKICAVFAVGGIIFWYYLYTLRKEPGAFPQIIKVKVWVILALASAIIIYGFIAVGSPFKQRLVRFDQQKINDLQTIQSQVVNYWQQKSKLPSTLTDLTDSISGFRAPIDPQTHEAYTYQKTANLSFTLCADFNLGNVSNMIGIRKPVGPFPAENYNWDHGIGNACFERIIDPELYKPLLKVPSS